MFFFQFLDTGDRWREFLANCPLDYIGNRGSGKLNVMGTALLGMAKIVSEDVVHTALKRVDETQSLSWVQGHILASISPALSLPTSLLHPYSLRAAPQWNVRALIARHSRF